MSTAPVPRSTGRSAAIAPSSPLPPGNPERGAPFTLTHTYTYARTHTHTHTYTHTHTHIYTHKHTHTHSLSLSLSHTHTRTHTHTYAHTHSEPRERSAEGDIVRVQLDAKNLMHEPRRFLLQKSPVICCPEYYRRHELSNEPYIVLPYVA